MPFTPLHRELGISGSDLTFALISGAISDRIEESSDLDWKSSLPTREQHEEFAKDVAAMANSGGGLLVFGVEEERDSSAAVAVRHLEVWGDADERRLRQVAYSAIQPPVHGLTFTAVGPEDERVVIMDIPASLDAPHLVWKKNGPAFSAPIRYGATTEYMNERQLAAAYDARRENRQAVERRAEGVVSEVSRRVGKGAQDTWVIVSAIPAQPRPSHLPRLSAEDFTTILATAQGFNPLLRDNHGGGFGISPRAGLRRWVSLDQYGNVLENLTEVHDDGAVVYAARAHQIRDGEPNDLHPMALQVAIAHAVWLTRQAAQRIEVRGDYIVRADVHSSVAPLFIRQYRHGSVLTDRDLPVHQFAPVHATIEPHRSLDGLASTARGIVTDIFNQGGIADIGSAYLLTPSQIEDAD